ncbi:hypothetical protein EJV46_16075 [Roseococcus sp. SYP-B2431]|uniref:hypothetical protein n=1 Tax=Roseococcus sp. SYP-B2431 TaxID=2496640 RepID=UPI001039214D|nr:hypothetical protein [Roseococcus sp. SYP-B2431]TCH97635.1 hypothetical protein EJV46_16075 [Roseococcus sp. SYP-B2431]
MAVRRNILFGAAAVMLLERAAAAPVAPHPDAELIALCAEHRELERRKIAEWDSRPRNITFEAEAALDAATTDPMIGRQGEIAERLAELKATTAEGLLAWITMVATFDADLSEFDPDDDFSGRMLACICRDAIALLAGSAA